MQGTACNILETFPYLNELYNSNVFHNSQLPQNDHKYFQHL